MACMSEVMISVANVPTERARRYGHQLASHMGRKIDAQWDAESARGTLIFTREGMPGGECAISCTDQHLRLELKTSPEAVEHLEFVVGIHLARFGYRDGLEVAWMRKNPIDGVETPGTTQGPLTAEDIERHRRSK